MTICSLDQISSLFIGLEDETYRWTDSWMWSWYYASM